VVDVLLSDILKWFEIINININILILPEYVYK